MKKTIALLITFGLVAAFGQSTVPPDSKKTLPVQIEPFDAAGFGFAEKIFDFVITNSGDVSDDVYGNVFDIRKLSFFRHTDADAAAIAASIDSLLGKATVSCYDISDSAAVTDSVNATLTIQGADYASNNSNPGTPHSDAWYTLLARTITDVSAASAQVTNDTIAVTLPFGSHTPQFIRVRGQGVSTAAQNDQRCRVFLYRPRFQAL